MPREAWSYAVLLIILFAIASIAVWRTIDYLGDHLPHEEFPLVAGVLWSLTLGFMLIAGAFGLWATHFAAEAESRRRISRLVEAMDYIRDGLVVLDSKGRITGANPAARALSGKPEIDRQPLHMAFPCLSEKDVVLLANTSQPNEIERPSTSAAEPHTLRFRSQPSKSVLMVLVSDVTMMIDQRARGRQTAQLQLIGEIARGVSHDFNTLLCSISGHAAVLGRLVPGIPELCASARAITRAADRGIMLAGRMIGLARAVPHSVPSQLPGVHIQNAADSIRNTLPYGWSVECMVDTIPPVSVAGIQVEQIVLNIGLLAADRLNEPGTLRITAGRPDDDSGFACTVSIASARTAPAEHGSMSAPAREPADTGLIQSVIRSMIHESGGTLNILTSGQDGITYQILLPHSVTRQNPASDMPFPDELSAYISQWSVLLATPHREFSLIGSRLTDMNVNVQRTDSIVAVLAQAEGTRHYDAMILDQRIIEQEPRGLLRAILKLKPSTGLVVLTDSPAAQPLELIGDVSFVSASASPNEIVLAMIDAKSVAVRRSAT